MFEKRVIELKKLLADKNQERENIFNKASEEQRTRTAEESAQWKTLTNEINAMREELHDLEQQIEESRAQVRPVDFAAPGKSDVGKSEVKNLRKAQLHKIVRSANDISKLDGVEKELQSVAIEEFKACGITDYRSDAASIPGLLLRHISWNQEQREREYRDVTTGANLGQELINTVTDRNNYVEALRPYNVVVGAGVEVILNTSGDNINYPRENSLYSAAMAATENATATESMTATLFTTLSFTPKRATGFMQLSNQMGAPVFQGGSDIEARIRTQILRSHGTVMDVQAISGTGASGQARGFLNTSGTGTVVGGANGANFSRAFITQFESVAGAAGADLSRCVYITNFSINAFGKRTETSTGSGRYLIDAVPSWMFGQSPTGVGNISMIDSYRAFLSSNVPNNLVKGTSGAVCSAVIFGNPDDAKYMQFGGYQIIVDPYVNATSALTNYVSHQWFDFNVVRPASWVFSADMLTP
jgi:HK97 family phage major capsid protein